MYQFILIGPLAYPINTDLEVRAAREALRGTGLKHAAIWVTNDPDAHMGQKASASETSLFLAALES